jgi:hypothetical protein
MVVNSDGSFPSPDWLSSILCMRGKASLTFSAFFALSNLCNLSTFALLHHQHPLMLTRKLLHSLSTISRMIALPPALEALTARTTSSASVQDLPPLVPTKAFNTSLRSEIDKYVETSHSSQSVRLVLHLLNDDIEAAHPIAQENEGDKTSDLCHGILHRREGEYWNSRLWYKLIKHPLVDEIYGGTPQAQTFIDDVEAMVKNTKGASTACAAGNLETLKRKQADELSAILRYAMQDK